MSSSSEESSKLGGSIDTTPLKKRFKRIITQSSSSDSDVDKEHSHVTSSSDAITLPIPTPTSSRKANKREKYFFEKTTQLIPRNLPVPDSSIPSTSPSNSNTSSTDSTETCSDYGSLDKITSSKQIVSSDQNRNHENEALCYGCGGNFYISCPCDTPFLSISEKFNTNVTNKKKESDQLDPSWFRRKTRTQSQLEDVDAEADSEDGFSQNENEKENEDMERDSDKAATEVETLSDVDDTEGEGDKEAAGSSSSESVSGAENELDEMPSQGRYGIPLVSSQVDSLDTISATVLDEIYKLVRTNVEERIHSRFEFSFQFYKLSPRGKRVHYIPMDFVEKLRSLELPISYRRYCPKNHCFLFQMDENIFQLVVAILDALPIYHESHPLTKNGHSVRAVRALGRYFSLNVKAVEPVINQDFIVFLQKFQDYHIRPYQQEAVEFAINRGGRCMFADEEGMGKRVEAIVTGRYYKDEWPMLVVCATSRMPNWNEELKYYGVKNIVCLETTEDCKKFSSNCEIDSVVVIIGYSTLKEAEAADELKKLHCKVLILDESHRIKHKNTKTAKVVRHLIKRAKRRILLTANPAFGVPEELFRQLHALDRVAFEDYVDFADQYCGMVTDDKGEETVSRSWRHAKNLDELKQILFGTLVIRHFRSDYHQLPLIKREKVHLEFCPDERMRRLLGTVQYRNSKAEYDQLDVETTKGAWIFKWFKRSGIAKLIEICKYLDSIDYEASKVIIYARHKCVMDGIEELLKRKKLCHIVFKGDYQTRQDLSDQFNSDHKIRVALLSLQVSNVCINLSSANLVVFAELLWVPDSLLRNENRSYSLKSPNNPNRVIEVKYLVAVDQDLQGESLHIDALLWEMLSGKMDVLNRLGLLKDVFTETIPQVEFRAEPSDLVTDLCFPDMSSNEESDSDEYQPSTEEIEEEDSSSGEDEGVEDEGSSYDATNEDGSHISAFTSKDVDVGSKHPESEKTVGSKNSSEVENSFPKRPYTRSQGRIEKARESSSSSKDKDSDNSDLDDEEVSLSSSCLYDGSNDGIPRGQNSDSETSLKNFLTYDSSDDGEGESNEEEEYIPGRKKSPKKRRPKLEREKSSSEDTESEDDSEDYEKEVVKNTKSYFH